MKIIINHNKIIINYNNIINKNLVINYSKNYNKF